MNSPHRRSEPQDDLEGVLRVSMDVGFLGERDSESHFGSSIALFSCPIPVVGNRVAHVVVGRSTRRCNSRRGSVSCKAVAHRLFSGREQVPSSQSVLWVAF